MRKVFVIIFTLFLTIEYINAKEKIVDTSGKSPKWIYATEQEYIIVSAESQSLEEAKNKCILQVKKHILSSVAESVQATSSMGTQEVGMNGSYNIMETYVSIVETQSAQIPFLSEIGLNKAEDFYWEKIKNDKEITYRYHLKYPFGKFDLARMVDDFQSKERMLNNQLAEFAADNFSSYTSVDQMMDRMHALHAFKATLMDGDNRKKNCQKVEQLYNEYIRTIQIRLVAVSKEELVFALYYRNQVLTNHLQPKLQTNCLTNMQYVTRGTEGVVTYDYHTGCYEDEQNYLDISFNINGSKVKNHFIIK